MAEGQLIDDVQVLDISYFKSSRLTKKPFNSDLIIAGGNMMFISLESLKSLAKRVPLLKNDISVVTDLRGHLETNYCLFSLRRELLFFLRMKYFKRNTTLSCSNGSKNFQINV